MGSPIRLYDVKSREPSFAVIFDNPIVRVFLSDFYVPCFFSQIPGLFNQLLLVPLELAIFEGVKEPIWIREEDLWQRFASMLTALYYHAHRTSPPDIVA